MSEAESITVTLPAELAEVVQSAVANGDCRSASDVVRDALHDWTMKRSLQVEELASLKAAIEVGISDIAAGRLVSFDPARIIDRGRRLLADRSRCA